MLQRFAFFIFLTTFMTAPQAHLAHHWHYMGNMTRTFVTNGGSTSLFIYAGSPNYCEATDEDGDMYALASGINSNQMAIGVCRMALKFNIGSGCSVNPTTNMYVCSLEVNPANCTISADGNKVTCI